MITIIVLTIVSLGLGFAIWKLDRIDEKITLGVDNPYYDNKSNKMSLDKYEKELDKVFDYKKVKNSIPDEEKDYVEEDKDGFIKIKTEFIEEK